MKRREFLHSVGAGSALSLWPRQLTWPAAIDADRMSWWREARFGMFVHFGLYSTLGGEWKGKETGSHEWIRNNARIPHDEYIPLIHSFNPTRLDVDALVRMAKDAGQKYIVVTTKHHEGFSLFDSAVTTYDVMGTPYHRDIMRDFARACRRHGLRLGWYYSIMDWYHPDYLPRRDWELRSSTGADFTRYLTFMRAQLRELLTRYGDIAVMWFDGQWEPTWNHALGQSTYDYCRTLQPQVIVNNRVDVKVEGGTDTFQGSGRAGDFSTPELEVPATGLPGVDWESCMTMNHNWGYSKFDHDFKSVRQLVGLLVETASKGGNLLLNVGPMGDGAIPAESVNGLRGVGDWMRVNSSSIYGTTVTPFSHASFRVTQKGNRLHVFAEPWPAGEFELKGLRDLPRSVTLLADPTAGSWPARRTADGVAITLPDRAPGDTYPVVVLDFDTPPAVAP